MKYDIIIIGAGCAGLLAMQELLAAGYRVCLLEAAPSAGGRVATIKEQGFDMPVEAGAEFIHGRLPLTRKLLRKATIRYEAMKGKLIDVTNGKWNTEEEHTRHWEELLRMLHRQKNDITISAFLDNNFSDPAYKELRNAVQGMAEGLDLADIEKASILSVRKEWEQEEQNQYRIPGGYGQLVDYLLNNCLKLKGRIFFNCCAHTVEYRKGHVRVTSNDKKKFEAARLIVTPSIGVLQSGSIVFNPSLGVHDDAIRQIGFGTVIKIQLQFKKPFWNDEDDNIGFLITDEAIPTWWTQLPVKNNMLTGWLGGPKANFRAKDSESTLLKTALQSLSSIFHAEITELNKLLAHYKISCWLNNPFIRGGYSYHTLFSEKAVEILSEPVAGSIFFAGEAIYSGESPGTVEAALQSGLAVAKKIRKMKV